MFQYKSNVLPQEDIDAWVNGMAMAEDWQVFGFYEQGQGSGMWLVVLVRHVAKPAAEPMAMKG